MRRVLLWMAENRRLRAWLPRLWFVRRAVRRFLPGEDVRSALLAAEDFSRLGIGALFTRLGENLTRVEEADSVAAHYLSLLDSIVQRGVDGEISVKLTQLGFDLDADRTLDHVASLAEHAAPFGRTVWIDMESSGYVEATLGLYERVRSEHPNVGICLQSYLRRTAADVQRLLPLGPTIRLVKGAYEEPALVAYQARRDVDANYLALAVMVLEASRGDSAVRLGLGTHDIRLIEQVATCATAMGLSQKTSFEVQMLYGIRTDQQRRLAREGYAVRALTSYGDAWYPWYLRRLAERPANVLFMLRQVVSR